MRLTTDPRPLPTGKREKLAMAVVVAVALATFVYARGSHGETQQARVPVLVELFTSEGCSDCPPADRVLADLAQDQPVPGAFVVALGEHVDYWNNGAWSDRFSSSAFDKRQDDYVRRFGLDSAYTPEMVVDGRREFVGSDADTASEAIRNAAARPHALVQVSVAGLGRGIALLNVAISGLPRSDADVFAAITEDGLKSRVTGGENGGHTLIHAAVVRRLAMIATVTAPTYSVAFDSAFRTQPGAATIRVPIDPTWPRSRLHAVVFVQDADNNAILGAGIADL